MKIVIPGGSGQVGQILARYFHAKGDSVTVLSRSPKTNTPWRTIAWDGETLGPWTAELEGADAVIHLSGRTVNCRYTPENRRQILDSRVIPTRLLGRAIQQAAQPPKLWMNASTSTVYRHTLDHPQDEFTGEILTPQPGVPETFNFSVGIGLQWEQAFYESNTPATRKIALRTSLVMSPDHGGVFFVLLGLVRAGLGGTQGNGRQYVSWVHDHDYVRAIDFLIRRPDISGPVNMTSPSPQPNRDFMRTIRETWKMPVGLPAYAWMLEIGAVFLRTETELILKSRRVVPGVLLEKGFQFEFPDWPNAAADLVKRTRKAAS
jgi:uncharacterized protein (TIGR01777 family)